MTIQNKKLLNNATDVQLIAYPHVAYIIVCYSIDKKLLYIQSPLRKEINFFNTYIEDDLYKVKFKVPNNMSFVSKLAIEFGESAFNKQSAINAMKYWQ